MATQKDGKDPQGPGNQHNDWGRSQAGAEGNAQSGGAPGTGGVGHRHRDWGHSDVGRSQQGVIPGAEAGELQTGLGGTESLSTGNAGSRQSEDEEPKK